MNEKMLRYEIAKVEEDINYNFTNGIDNTVNFEILQNLEKELDILINRD